jgi:hypothetical protein
MTTNANPPTFREIGGRLKSVGFDLGDLPALERSFSEQGMESRLDEIIRAQHIRDEPRLREYRRDMVNPEQMSPHWNEYRVNFEILWRRLRSVPLRPGVNEVMRIRQFREVVNSAEFQRCVAILNAAPLIATDYRSLERQMIEAGMVDYRMVALVKALDDARSRST